LLGADYRLTDNRPVPYRCISNTIAKAFAHLSMASPMTHCCTSTWLRTNFSTMLMFQSLCAQWDRPLRGHWWVIPVTL